MCIISHSSLFKYSFTVVPVVEKELISRLGSTNEAIFYKIINKVSFRLGKLKIVCSFVFTQEVDGTISSFIASPDRKERMDFTFFLWTEPCTLLVPTPELESRLFAFIRPFQPMVKLTKPS